MVVAQVIETVHNLGRVGHYPTELDYCITLWFIWLLGVAVCVKLQLAWVANASGRFQA